MAQPGEFDIIARYFSGAGRTAPHRVDVVLGVGDDAALLRVPQGLDLVAAVDTVVAGRHFPLHTDPQSVGHRALAVNLSDLAAMGATPAWATLALTLPTADAPWLAKFSSGFLDLAEAHGVALVGGDTTSGPLSVTVQIMGTVPQDRALRRDGARPGDLLAVTGSLGDGGAGLALSTGALTLEPGAAAQARCLIRRFDYPSPRVGFGKAALGLASGAMDLSDGLVGDLPKLLAASGVGACVEVGSLPLSAALRAAVPLEQARAWALAAGDDYELLLSVAPDRLTELVEAARRADVPLTVIGEVRPGNAITYRLDGRPFDAPVHGWDHFR